MINKIYSTSFSLLTDLYQLTMSYGYWKKGIHLRESNFSVFFRKNPFNSGYAVCCGLEFIIDYLKNLKFTESDSPCIQITYLRLFPNETIYCNSFIVILIQESI